MKLTKKLNEDHGCPYFFNDRCSVKINNQCFNDFCLDNYTNCDAYKKIIEDEQMFIGSKK